MRILSLEFRNLKGASTGRPILFGSQGSHSTFSPQNTVIFGDNGAGKSTVLEALAILTTVPTFTEIDPSPDPNESDAVIEIRVQLGDQTGREGTVRFWTSRMNGEKITGALSSEDENELRGHGKFGWAFGPGDGTDIEFCIALQEQLDYSFPKRSESGRLSISERRNLLEEWDRAPTSERRDIAKFLSQKGTIAYINTDQNSFGFGLNVLESPKDLAKDALSVVHERLPMMASTPKSNLLELRSLNTEVPCKGKRAFSLNKYWGRVFQNRQNEVEDPRIVECKTDGSQFRIRLFKESIGEYSPKFFSSGENEVFFIVSLILSCQLHNSVLLLDEPELHLSPERQLRFYRVLRQLGDAFRLQFIVVTHSPLFADKVFSDDKDADISGKRKRLGNIRSERSQLRELKRRGTTVVAETDREKIVGPVREFMKQFFDEYQ